MITSAVTFIVFNRPWHTKNVFEKIRQQKPQKLFIVADGPRLNSKTDQETCREVRELVECIDWPCRTYRNYAESNLGLKQRVSSGLNWVFSQEEQSIILEDDCLPHEEFFTFCESLLERYKNDDRVAVITGNNFQGGFKRGKYSYYFSKYNHCWGWATWRRAWKYYDGDLTFWPDWCASEAWQKHTQNKKERFYWENIFKKVRSGQINSWAYPWTASIWRFGGLTVTPNENLVSNIGFGKEATNTKFSKSKFAAIPTRKLGKILHPENVIQDFNADQYIFEKSFGKKYTYVPIYLLKLFYFVKKLLKK